MLTVSDYVIAERSLLDPDQVVLKNLYHNTEVEAGPEVWTLLKDLAGANGQPLLEELRQARIVVEAGQPETVSEHFEELEEALDAFLRKYLPADFELEKHFPSAPASDFKAYRECLRRKLEAACQIWLKGLETYFAGREIAGPAVEPKGDHVGEGAWLYEAPDLFVRAMFDHLCMIVDAVIGEPIRGLCPEFLAATTDRPPQKEHLHQQPCSPRTTLDRVERIVAQCPPPARVLVLGDDDLMSLALARHEGYSIDVLELDKELVEFLARSAPSVRILQKDLSMGLDADFKESYDIVISDPPYNRDGMRFFLHCCAGALKPAASSRLFLSTCLILVEDAEDLHEYAAQQGLSQLKFTPGFSFYPLAEHLRIWGMNFFEGLGLPSHLGATLLDQPFLWADLLEYAPTIAADNLTAAQMDLVESRSTEFQTICLYERDGAVCLTNNAGIQFHSEDEAIHHERMMTLPMCLSEQAESVLILGGGDGLAAREALKFPSLKRLVVVDIDAEMLALTKDHPLMQKVTGNAFNDPRVELVAADALRWLEQQSDRFDVILNDWDYLRTHQDSTVGPQRVRDFLAAQREHLREGGAVSMYHPHDPFGADFLGCPLEKVPEALEQLVGDLFKHRLVTHLDSERIGPHVFVIGLSNPPLARRSPPEGSLYVDLEELTTAP
ncbi:MAG: bis-aminopropyl spermidine synthase family protein [Vulcanimicrobiota bacterium]